MPAAIKNYIVEKGVDWLQSVTLLQTLVPRVPDDLTGCSAMFTCKGENGGDVIFLLTISNGGVVIDPLIGLISFKMTAVQTSALLTAGCPIKTISEIVGEDSNGKQIIVTRSGPTAPYDIQFIDSLGVSSYLLTGYVCMWSLP